MKIYVSSPPLADDTAYGFELRYLDMARKLLEAGVSLEDLKECSSNISWALEVVWKDVDAQLERAFKKDIHGGKEWAKS